MKKVFLVLTLIFSLSTLTVFSQIAANKQKSFPKELRTMWYYPFIEELNLIPQDFYEFDRFFINGTLVSKNETKRVFVKGIAILNNRSLGNDNLDEFEVFYFSVFEAMTDFEIYFEKAEFWEFDQNGKLVMTKTVNAKEGHYYNQYYRSDNDVRCTGELYYNDIYLDMLDTYGIE